MVARQFWFAQSVPHFDVSCWNTGRLGTEKLTMAQYTTHRELMDLRGRSATTIPFNFCFNATLGFADWWYELSIGMYCSGYQEIKISFGIGKFAKNKPVGGVVEREKKGKRKSVATAKTGGQSSKKSTATAVVRAKTSTGKDAPTSTRRSKRLIGRKRSTSEVSNKKQKNNENAQFERSNHFWEESSSILSLKARLEPTKVASYVKTEEMSSVPEMPLGVALQQITEIFQLSAKEVYTERIFELLWRILTMDMERLRIMVVILNMETILHIKKIRTLGTIHFLSLTMVVIIKGRQPTLRELAALQSSPFRPTLRQLGSSYQQPPAKPQLSVREGALRELQSEKGQQLIEEVNQYRLIVGLPKYDPIGNLLKLNKNEKISEDNSLVLSPHPPSQTELECEELEETEEITSLDITSSLDSSGIYIVVKHDSLILRVGDKDVDQVDFTEQNIPIVSKEGFQVDKCGEVVHSIRDSVDDVKVGSMKDQEEDQWYKIEFEKEDVVVLEYKFIFSHGKENHYKRFIIAAEHGFFWYRDRVWPKQGGAAVFGVELGQLETNIKEAIVAKSKAKEELEKAQAKRKQLEAELSGVVANTDVALDGYGRMTTIVNQLHPKFQDAGKVVEGAQSSWNFLKNTITKLTQEVGTTPNSLMPMTQTPPSHPEVGATVEERQTTLGMRQDVTPPEEEALDVALLASRPATPPAEI
ncbi:OLC1v1005621C1 [Oldenlandia corymbosa var. corymbosa]|uniref:OLC1v1005621C1 n=1 Tax=Oldenlandia corymbosa var. corymbosa TaxID=529605 RepID=A0AAV1DFA4_OLDCO|nr:OLC1v1005621C1 [Oldenlandia corymbosa var. corymbosa]